VATIKIILHKKKIGWFRSFTEPPFFS